MIVLVASAVAHAADPVEDGRIRDAQVLLEEIPKHAAAGDKAALRRCYPQLVELHNKLRTKGALRGIQKTLGKIVRDKDVDLVVRLETVDTLAKLFDADGAWKQLEKLMPEDDDEAVGQLGLRVLRAVRSLAPDGAIRDLEDLVYKGKDLNASQAALEALGAYGYSRKRAKVLDFIMEQIKRLQPGTSRSRIARVNRERFDALSERFVQALNDLTGRNLRSTEAWFDLYEQNKGKADKLFVKRRVR